MDTYYACTESLTRKPETKVRNTLANRNLYIKCQAWVYLLTLSFICPEKRPVLVGHGLFQCSGDFVLNEEGSLAFVLAKWGYDVWLGNTRATLTWEHDYLSHKDKEYWAWGLKELGLYDWVAMIDFVRQSTGYEKVRQSYIVHEYAQFCSIT